ncbi:MAG TPA: hypothetical protein VLE20_14575 [Blastocatellia bacterium]|nr:hypothetical protein [Blastocatellia bacterium]
MPYQLEFRSLHNYDPGKSGISVPITLRSGSASVALNAKVDTGATYCIFQRLYGEHLGLDIERGHQQLIGTPTGSFVAYGHEVSLSVLEFEFDAVVYFAADDSFNRDVLGRHGWLSRVQLGIVDYKGKLYLDRIDEA